MKINKYQKIILLAMAALIILTFIFPPFLHEQNAVSMGYGNIFIGQPRFAGGRTGLLTVNVALLLAEWFGIVLIGIIAMMLSLNNTGEK